jgi:hypothetical protein
MVQAMMRNVFPNESSLGNTLWPILKSATASPRSRAPALWSGRCWMMWRMAAPGSLFAALVGADGFPSRPWAKRSNFRGNPGWTSAEDWRALHSPNGLRFLPLEPAGREFPRRSAFLTSRVVNSFSGFMARAAGWPGGRNAAARLRDCWSNSSRRLFPARAR